MKPSETLSLALSELGLSLCPEARQQLLALATLVDRWGARINLTGHRGVEGVLEGLVLDALALERVLPDCTTLLDMGSGAGFPGFPIAIARPGSRLTLLEARERRHHFQRAAIRELALRNVSPRLGRAEVLEPTGHEIVLAQALARPARAIQLMRDWVAPGGRIALALSDPQGSGIPVALEGELRRYRVPRTGVERALWIGTPPR